MYCEVLISLQEANYIRVNVVCNWMILSILLELFMVLLFCTPFGIPIIQVVRLWMLEFDLKVTNVVDSGSGDVCILLQFPILAIMPLMLLM